MITKEEIKELLQSTETYRVERTTSTGDMDKFQEAICAFSNDLPNSRQKGYLILGAYDASAMKTLGYVNMFNRGVRQVQSDLKNNSNKLAVFDVNLLTAFRVIVESVTSNVVKDVVKIDLSQLSDRQITILEFMIQNPAITAKEMSQRLSLTSRTVQRDIANLTKLGMIIREGGRYDGLWKVIATKK